MPKNKKQKEYSTSYEKKISINPMTIGADIHELGQSLGLIQNAGEGTNHQYGDIMMD